MRDLIVFCHLRWDFVFQRPQHVLTRLAKRYRVTVVEEPIFTDGQSRLDVTSPAPNVSVARPMTSHRSPGFSDGQIDDMARLLVEHAQRHGIVAPIVWFYTPMPVELLDIFQPAAVVYDCMDELSAFRHAPPELLDREASLLRRADIVFTGGPSLYEAKRKKHARVICLPSAVDAFHYAPRSSANEGSAPIPARHCGQRPTLGFFGVIDERLDLDLIAALAEADPTWEIVMVGPVVKVSPDALPQAPNIRWVGQQAYDRLPSIVAQWDVCLLPFALNESTTFISPTKTLEYLAAEKPVVSTPIRDVALLFGHAVSVQPAGRAFVQACRDALDESPAARQDRLKIGGATVGQYSWDATVSLMADAIEQVIAQDRPHAAVLLEES